MRYLLIICALTIFYSCSPKLKYLGDNHPPTTEIDVFYSRSDVKVEYTVIGKLTGRHGGIGSSLEKTKQSMIEDAKLKGANGIIFGSSNSYNDGHRIKANLILYSN